MKRSSAKRLMLVVTLLTFHIAGGLFLGHKWFESRLDEAVPGVEGEFFIVESGSTIREIAELMEERGIISSSFLLRLHMRLEYPGASIKAGEYQFNYPVTIRRTALKLVQGRVFYHRVTVPEGLDWQETAASLEAQGYGKKQEFLELIADPGQVLDLDPEADNLEGYLFPETYFVTRDVTPKEIIEMMVSRFRRNWTGELSSRAGDLEMSVREVVTLASLIEKEASLPGERPLVSSVFHNRLKSGMKLGCDPTVIYAVKLVKPWDGIIHRSDLQLDSPYNTYIYPGLPPGPIASPGLASIRAALFPEDTGLLYFVSRNDGSHVFSENYRDHAEAVEKYQR